ncbi:MAG: hypothetical protein WDZ35_03690 [Crocinitomicaceae bacterium]
MRFRFVLSILLFYSLPLYGQKVERREFLDSIEIEYNGFQVPLIYKDQKTGELFSGIIYWESKKNIQIFQVRKGIQAGFSLEYSRYSKEWRLEQLEYYNTGHCLERIRLKKKKGVMKVSSTAIYDFSSNPNIVLEGLLWIAVDYLNKGYGLTLALKNSNGKSPAILKTKIGNLEQIYIPSIMEDLDKMKSQLIVKSKGEIIFPKFLLNRF